MLRHAIRRIPLFKLFLIIILVGAMSPQAFGDQQKSKPKQKTSRKASKPTKSKRNAAKAKKPVRKAPKKVKRSSGSRRASSSRSTPKKKVAPQRSSPRRSATKQNRSSGSTRQATSQSNSPKRRSVTRPTRSSDTRRATAPQRRSSDTRRATTPQQRSSSNRRAVTPPTRSSNVRRAQAPQNRSTSRTNPRTTTPRRYVQPQNNGSRNQSRSVTRPVSRSSNTRQSTDRFYGGRTFRAVTPPIRQSNRSNSINRQQPVRRIGSVNSPNSRSRTHQPDRRYTENWYRSDDSRNNSRRGLINRGVHRPDSRSRNTSSTSRNYHYGRGSRDHNRWESSDCRNTRSNRHCITKRDKCNRHHGHCSCTKCRNLIVIGRDCDRGRNNCYDRKRHCHDNNGWWRWNRCGSTWIGASLSWYPATSTYTTYTTIPGSTAWYADTPTAYVASIPNAYSSTDYVEYPDNYGYVDYGYTGGYQEDNLDSRIDDVQPLPEPYYEANYSPTPSMDPDYSSYSGSNYQPVYTTEESQQYQPVYTTDEPQYQPVETQTPGFLEMGEDAFAKGDYDEARRLFIRAVFAMEEDPYAQLDYGLVHFATGDYAVSASAFRRAMALEPMLIDTLPDVSTAYGVQGDFDSHLYQLEEHLRKNPGDADARFLLGVIRLTIGDPHGSLPAFTRALQKNPRDTSAYLLRDAALRAMRESQIQ